MTPFTLNGYDHDGILLNLYGSRDADGCEIDRATDEDGEEYTFMAGEREALQFAVDARWSKPLPEYRPNRNWRAEVRRQLGFGMLSNISADCAR